MSRVGKKPITIPQGVEVSVTGQVVEVRGPKGTLSQIMHPLVTATLSGDANVKYITVSVKDEKKKYTVNRSTFVHKDSRDQFEMRVHKRIIDITETTDKTIDALMSLNLPAGVDVEIKT